MKRVTHLSLTQNKDIIRKIDEIFIPKYLLLTSSSKSKAEIGINPELFLFKAEKPKDTLNTSKET